MIKKLGWIPDLPDARDQYLTLKIAPLPSSYEMKLPFAYDQGALGSA